jgi:serine/threonine protein kinase
MESPTDILNDQGVFGNGIYKSDNDLQVDAGESSSSPSSPPPKTVRVSFREGTKPPTTCTGSHRSLTDFSMSDDTSYSSGSNLQHYSRLRSNLTRSQINRNPLYFYQVTKTLGEGSMGDVKLVVKRRDKIGGSARRDIQQAVRRQKMHQKCLRLPLVGGIFRFCIDGDLPDNVDSNSHHSRRTPNTSTHSVLSLFSQNTAESAAGRSFEDSLLGGDDEENKDDSNNVYAMKSILIDQVARQEFVDELRNEIAILKDLDHPNIVRAIETFEWKGAISIVMEVCSGGDLYSRDPYSEEEANRIIRSVLSAISYMHSRNVAHRDLKYENILFVSKYTSEVKLIDFGLSRVYQDTAHLTDIAGTIYTMAPEVLQGFHTEKADLWSIGVLAYMLLVSSLPFYGRDRDSIITKIFRNKPSFREKRWNDVSKEAKLFINRLLVSDPDRRIDAETALKSPWITMYTEHASASSTDDVTSEQRALVREAILRYAEYPKLKKMALMVVAHKSNSDEIGMLKKVFKQYDTRHDGSIWFGDFCANMQPSKLSGDELRDVFDAMVRCALLLPRCTSIICCCSLPCAVSTGLEWKWPSALYGVHCGND